MRNPRQHTPLFDQAANYKAVLEAGFRIDSYIEKTAFDLDARLSNMYESNVFVKREDLSAVRSFKLRGALNKLLKHKANNPNCRQVVCASAGNHAQGVAYACRKLNLSVVVFMPETTPAQKVEQVEYFGGDQVEVRLLGKTVDESLIAAKSYQLQTGSVFVHPFDDIDVMAGQGTVALEMLQQLSKPVDYLFVPVGGGGLLAGVLTVMKRMSPKTKVVGVEPSGAAALGQSLKQGSLKTLVNLDTFADGASVARVGDLGYQVSEALLDEFCEVSNQDISECVLSLHNNAGWVVEPAGAMAFAAMAQYRKKLKGKQVGVILSGGNNDFTRFSEFQQYAEEGERYAI